MGRLWGWIKNNKLLSFLILLVLFLLLRGNLTSLPGIVPQARPPSLTTSERAISPGIGGTTRLPSLSAPSGEKERIIIKETTLSLVVGNVAKVLADVEGKAKQLGGFLVSSNLNVPEGVATGTIKVRVPEEKRGEALAEFKKLAVKVVSENIAGFDVTDEYTDLAARLAILEQTKAKFQAILEKATLVADLLEVQRELITIQDQIDAVKGQQKYLEQTAKLSLITVYLATDELSLPYTPDQAWRPNLVFKQAVRAMIGFSQFLGNVLIWVGVFTPVWLPAGLVIWWLKRRKKTHNLP